MQRRDVVRGSWPELSGVWSKWRTVYKSSTILNAERSLEALAVRLAEGGDE